jgi:hypothetical protein
MEDPDIPEVDEKDYRYPGPKPQTRETAICLLADGTEAASRALPDPTPARLKGLVQRMINKAFTDGQLDECDLTLKDLNSISLAFNRILAGIYHHRPEYPEQAQGQRQPRSTPAGGTRQEPAEATARTRRAAESQKGAEKQKPAEKEQTLAEASSDVWEITKEKVESMQQESDADRSSDSAERDKPSQGAKPEPDDTEEGRESLPRLGTS